MKQEAREGKKPTLKDYKELSENYQKLEERVEKAEDIAKKYEDAQKAGLIHATPTTNRAGSDEAKCLSYYGASHVKQLLDMNTCDEKYHYVPENIKFMAYELKKHFQNARMLAQLFHGAGHDKVGATEAQDRFPAIPYLAETPYFKEHVAPRLKAFGSGVVGGGAEWIPTAISSVYVPEFELERQLIQQLREINMPTSPYEIPTATGLTTARKIAENVSATDASFTTGVIQFQAKKFVEYYILPEELVEDSAPDILDLGRSELTQAHLRAFETSVLNGTDPAGAHIDSDTAAGAADLAEKQYDGLRKYGLDNTANGGTVDFSNAVVSDANLRLMRQQMKGLGVNPRDGLFIASSVTYNQMMGTDNVVTVDKAGSAATIIKGSLANYSGIPIVVSDFLRDDLNATGVYDGVTTDRSGLLLVHRRRWYFATRRPIRMALRPSLSQDDRYEIAAYSRVDFQGHPQSAAEVGVVYGYNVALS